MTSQSDVRGTHRGRAASIVTLLLETVAPLALFYGLRAAGASQWSALLVSGAVPLVLLVYRILTERRVEFRILFTLSILVCGTVVGLLTGDPRLLVARESYLTGLVGLWMIGTLLAARPFILTATLPLLPDATARSWQDSWRNDTTFRRAMRFMTLGWGCAFLVDAAARLVMAYTIPLDLVPLLSTLLLVVLLVAVVQAGKAYGRRQSAGSDTDTDTPDHAAQVPPDQNNGPRPPSEPDA